MGFTDRFPFSDSFIYKDRKIDVEGLHGMLCQNCGSDPLLTDQVLQNQVTIANAKRTAFGMLTSMEIRAIRKKLGLSQKRHPYYLAVARMHSQSMNAEK